MGSGIFNVSLLKKEIRFSTSRSSGPGGQNVNKVNTKVTLRFDIGDSEALSESQKKILLKKLSGKLTQDGILILSSQEKRTQLQNKEDVVNKFLKLVEKSLVKPKPRKSTKPTKASVEKRLQSKKEIAEKKKWRGKLK